MIEPRAPQGGIEVADHYDELDWLYREVWGEHVHHGLWSSGHETPDEAVWQLVEHVARQVRLERGGEVVDVGCGYGATARQLHDEHGARVTGFTLSRAQYDYAMARQALGGPTYLLGDWLRNELPDEAFDAVIAIESTEHIADKAGCFAQARRVLRPGGRAAVCAWLASADARDWEERHLLEPICREGRLPGMGTAAEYRDLLERAGFEVERVEDLTERVKRTWSICISRVFARLWSVRRYRDFLFSARSRNRPFALSMLRIWMAYETGAMRYGLFTARRPSGRRMS